MASSLIPVLAVAALTSNTPAAPATDCERGGLLHALAAVPDPRDPRGVRYPLSALFTVAVHAVLAGASSFAAITDWLHDVDEGAQQRLEFDRGVPVGTVWRLLIRLDDRLLSVVLTGWLHTRTAPAGPKLQRFTGVP